MTCHLYSRAPKRNGCTFPQKTWPRVFLTASNILAWQWKPPTGPSTGEWIHTLWNSHTTEHWATKQTTDTHNTDECHRHEAEEARHEREHTTMPFLWSSKPSKINQHWQSCRGEGTWEKVRGNSQAAPSEWVVASTDTWQFTTLHLLCTLLQVIHQFN